MGLPAPLLDPTQDLLTDVEVAMKAALKDASRWRDVSIEAHNLAVRFFFQVHISNRAASVFMPYWKFT